jgi:uncharacterized protein YkwD
MNGKLSIIISVILATAAILTVPSSMLQISYAQSLSFQSCPDGSTPDASGNCPTLPPPAGGGETQDTLDVPSNLAPPVGDGGETAEAPPATETPPPAAPPATETPPPAAPPAGASQGATNNESREDFVNSILAVHNGERAAVGVPPLVWSDSLAASAQTWAEYQARTGDWRHATDAEKGGSYGENLSKESGHWFGIPIPQGSFSTESLQQGWVNEKTLYNGGPVDSTNYLIFGHYTQMVWRGTTQIGCATAITQEGVPPGAVGETVYLVCRYSPPGNQFGQAPY